MRSFLLAAGIFAGGLASQVGIPSVVIAYTDSELDQLKENLLSSTWRHYTANGCTSDGKTVSVTISVSSPEHDAEVVQSFVEKEFRGVSNKYAGFDFESFKGSRSVDLGFELNKIKVGVADHYKWFGHIVGRLSEVVPGCSIK